MTVKGKTLEQKRAMQRERHILNILATCVHFTGIQHNSCKAGINYHEQFGSGAGCFANIACTQAHPRDDFPMKECPSAKYPTRDEAEREETDRESQSRRCLEAMRLAHSDAKAKGYGVGSGGADSLKCPLCPDGILRYTVASYNGHMHAGCTSGCVSWME